MGFEEDILAAIDATITDIYDGDIVEGRVVKVGRDEVLIDIGYKTEGVIPSAELSFRYHVDPSDVVRVGDAVKALVLQKEDCEGRLILSRKRADVRAWDSLQQIKEEGGAVSGTVIELSPDGLIVDVGVPALIPSALVETDRVRDLHPYLGKELEAKVIELDRRRRRVILSRRARLEELELAEARDDDMHALREELARKAQQLACDAQELVGLRKQVADDASELAELREAAERHMASAEQAKNVARRLWASMPADGRLAYFESGSNWLPQWIVEKEN